MVRWRAPVYHKTASDWKPDTNREGRDYNSRSRVSPRRTRLERLIDQDKRWQHHVERHGRHASGGKDARGS